MQDNRKKLSIANQSLEQVFQALSGTQLPPTAKLARNILLTVERHRTAADFIINSRKKGRVKPRTQKVLLWALAEILWLDGVPAPAAVDTAVNFTKKKHSSSEAAFVNAFLRSIVRELETSSVNDLLADAPEWVKADIPEVLYKKWIKDLGAEETRHLAQVLQTKAKTILRRRQWPEPDGNIPEILQKIQAPEWAPEAQLFTPGDSSAPLDSIMKPGGDFYIQDPATLLAPSLLAPQPGEDVADLCCAPGGKARMMAEMMQGKGRLLCADKAKEKLPRVKENLSCFSNVDFACLDAAEAPLAKEIFHAVMLDVPCSNSGVIRRKPDVRQAFSLEKLSQLVKLQSCILENAAKSLRPGGRLVYSTCSIEREENMEQVNRFLLNHKDFKLLKSRTIMPDEDHDGSFAALLVKNED